METKGIKRNFVICFDHTAGDKAVLIVGERNEQLKELSIVGMHTGEDAVRLYKEMINHEN